MTARDSAGRLVSVHRALIFTSVQQRTLQDYQSSVRQFVEWVFDMTEEPTDIGEIDELAVAFVHYLYLTGQPKSHGHRLQSALHFFSPRLKRRLPALTRSLKGWDIAQPSQPWAPITYALAVSIAIRLWRHGYPDAAIAVLLAFDCYLRNSEATGLLVSDIALPGDIRLGGFDRAGVSIRRAKTGRNQFVPLRNRLVIRLLRRHLRGKHPRMKVFALTDQKFRDQFKLGQRLLGYVHPPYAVHACRHGGATHDYLAGTSVESVLGHGRWRSTNTARHYIQSGRSLLLQVVCPLSVKLLAAYYSQNPEVWFP
jgi:hypothetical protein